MGSIRSRRVESEWQLLGRLAAHNPAIIQVQAREYQAGADLFHVLLRQSGALSLDGGPVDEYLGRIVLTDLFPAVPIQAYVAAPLLHPNIHPLTGFVCLWDRFSPADSVVDTLLQWQAVASWTLYNETPDHLMQPDAFKQYPSRAPLPVRKIEIPPDMQQLRAYRGPLPDRFRRRLSTDE